MDNRACSFMDHLFECRAVCAIRTPDAVTYTAILPSPSRSASVSTGVTRVLLCIGVASRLLSAVQQLSAVRTGHVSRLIQIEERQ